MARRANKGIPPLFIVAVVLLVALAVGGSIILRNRGHDPFSGVSELDVRDYLENGNALRGSEFKVTGKVQNQLSWTPQNGRLFSIEVEGSYGTDLVPVLVPHEFNSININKGQTFIFKINVGERGILTAEQIEKT